MRLLWGGRFSEPPDKSLLDFASSYTEDRAIGPADVQASLVHVDLLQTAGVLSDGESSAVRSALQTIAREMSAGTFSPAGGFEDIHSAVEARVIELAGLAGHKLHAGRSRNDQVATAIALYVRDSIEKIATQTQRLVWLVLRKAEEELEAGSVMIGTTHGQPAQPILVAFWLHAVAVGLTRSLRRLYAAQEHNDRCPLGAAALAGTSVPLDRAAGARLLGFPGGPTENALHTVGDRGVALDALVACAQLLSYLSRVSADIIAWCSPLLGFVLLDDSIATGSSMMPHKKNPDVFELVRAKATSVAGLQFSALSSVNGLPLSYHRDLQELKRHLIAGIEETLSCVSAFSDAFAGVNFDRARCAQAAIAAFALATDHVEQLVHSGIPLRDAHRIVGERVKHAEAQGRTLTGAANSDAALKSVRAKVTEGSTNPDALAKAIAATRAALAHSHDLTAFNPELTAYKPEPCI